MDGERLGERTPLVARFRLPVAIAGATLLYGTLGYMVLEGWGALDALYMSVITLTTVGFREVRPLDASGQLFTISLLALGVVALLSAVAPAHSCSPPASSGSRSGASTCIGGFDPCTRISSSADSAASVAPRRRSSTGRAFRTPSSTSIRKRPACSRERPCRTSSPTRRSRPSSRPRASSGHAASCARSTPTRSIST